MSIFFRWLRKLREDGREGGIHVKSRAEEREKGAIFITKAEVRGGGE